MIRGNFAEGGHGGGIRLQQVNGADVAAFATDATRWHKVTITNNMIVNNVAGWAGGGISLADTLNSVIVNNTISSNDSTGIAGVLLTGGLPVQIPAAGVTGTTGKSHPNPAGISSDPTSTDLRNAGANIPVISAPTLTNNIVWHNRSFYYDGTSGTATLCASNDSTNPACGHLADQTSTGQCDTGNAKYWDLGILGAASSTAVGNVQPDAYAIASATQSTAGNNNPVRTVTAVLAIDSLLGNNQQVTIAGIAPGTSGLTQAQINGAYHGVFAITLIDADTFSYTARAFPAAVNISSIRKTSGVVTVTTSSPHGLVTGNQARIAVGNGTNNTNYGGTFIVTVLTPTTFTYSNGTNTSGPLNNNGTARLTLTDAQFALLDFSAATATPLAIVVQPVNNLSPTYSVLSSLTGYATANNTAVDPNLKDLYCNGARVTPEFSANNPPGSVNNLQVAATTDEGNNYVNLRYGPLYLAKPASATGAPYTAFGDYHLTASSAAAIDKGTTLAAVTRDIDGDTRPQGAAYDIGSDEFTLAAADLSITKTDGVTSVNQGGTVTYTIVVSNAGPGAVTAATVTDTFPAAITSTTWACVASAGSSCTAGGSGLARTGTVTLLNGGSATFTAVATVSATASGSLVNTATVSGTGDPNTANNSATDTDSIALPLPTLTTLDTFTRANAITLGGNWDQATLLGAAAIRVNTNQASDPTVPGNAYWNAAGSTFGAKQGAAFTIANATINGDSLILKETGATVAGVAPNFIRVQYTGGGNVVVATTTNFGLATTSSTTLNNANSTFANGDTLTALVDASGVVSVWKNGTFVGSVTLPNVALWTTGGGRIGMQLPAGARVDNFAGGTVP